MKITIIMAIKDGKRNSPQGCIIHVRRCEDRGQFRWRHMILSPLESQNHPPEWRMSSAELECMPGYASSLTSSPVTSMLSRPPPENKQLRGVRGPLVPELLSCSLEESPLNKVFKRTSLWRTQLYPQIRLRRQTIRFQEQPLLALKLDFDLHHWWWQHRWKSLHMNNKSTFAYLFRFFVWGIFF